MRQEHLQMTIMLSYLGQTDLSIKTTQLEKYIRGPSVERIMLQSEDQ